MTLIMITPKLRIAVDSIESIADSSELNLGTHSLDRFVRIRTTSGTLYTERAVFEDILAQLGPPPRAEKTPPSVRCPHGNLLREGDACGACELEKKMGVR